MPQAQPEEPSAGQADDFSTNHWGLETPSKFFGSASPNPWPAASGLTPSIFASLGTRGFTPSGLTPSGLGVQDSHTFDYFSFGAASSSSGAQTKRNSVAGSLDGAAEDSGTGVFGQDDDVFAGAFTRKRALSSPAIFTPGGHGRISYSFGNAADLHHAGGARMTLNGGPSSFKRPRFSTESSFSSGNSQKRSSFDSEETPESSTVLTPPDSTVPLPSLDAFAFNKGYSDANVDPFNFDLRQSNSISSAPVSIPVSAPVSTPGIPHSTYQQFSLPSTAMQLPHQPFAYELEQGIDASAALTSAVKPSDSSKTGSKGTKGAGARKGKKAMSEIDEDEVKEEEKTAAEKEAERRDFLERNRLAACKSRKKKKEKVGQLESSASELASKNAALQVVALSLRREVAMLREQVNTHDGCSCVHVKGYLDRELSGGGIACIDSIAGRVMDIDYTSVPTMGSEEDCYQDIFEPPPEAAELLAKAGKKSSAGKNRRTSTVAAPPKPVVAAPALRPGITTRRSTISAGDSALAAHAAFEQAVRDQAAAPGRSSLPNAQSFTFGAPIPIRNNGVRPMALPSLPTLPDLPLYELHPPSATGLEQFVRANSAPPTTPQWELSGGSYFGA